jgi:hypothetical protein
MFKKGTGDWTRHRGEGVREVDFHRSSKASQSQFHDLQAMEEVRVDALTALKTAYERGDKAVLFTHGWSTSRPGQQSSRSAIRSLMKNEEATPYICHSECIEYESVFVAAIRPRPAASDEAGAQGED